MDESFSISICYQHAEYTFESRIRWMGYIHKIEVDVLGTIVHFEPDEERNYRAVLVNPHEETAKELKPGLLEAIATYLEEQVKSK